LAKSKRNKEILWMEIAYIGHYCPSTGMDKSGKLGYFSVHRDGK